MDSNVFAYGTLLFPEVVQHLLDTALTLQKATLPGFRRYEALTRERGNYPAIVPDPGGEVTGVVARVTPHELTVLDQFEDLENGYYIREKVTVHSAGKQLETWAYVCGPTLRLRVLEPLGREWDPESFRATELEWYLDNIVGPLSRSFQSEDKES